MRRLLPLLVLSFLTACAAMQQQYVDTLCKTEGAYTQGYNDGHGAGRMDSSFASMCPAEQDALRRAYRDGFEKGAARIAAEPRPAIPPNGEWRCLESFGKKVCGYDCREAFGRVRCAQREGDNCVAAFGSIRCGTRCREQFGEIQCDRYE
jgi:hypothetical protein